MLGKKGIFSRFFKGKNTLQAEPKDRTEKHPSSASLFDLHSTKEQKSTVNRPVDFSSTNRAHGLFFTPETKGKDFSSVLGDVQEYISEHYSSLITAGGEDAKAQLKRYITKYIQDHRISVNGMSGTKLADALYTEMAEFGFLTKYIFGTGIEEIDSATRS